MQYFGEFREKSIHSMVRMPRGEIQEAFFQNPQIATLENVKHKEVISFAAEDGAMLSEDDLRNQFIVFQFSNAPDGPAILDMSEVIPVKKGGIDKPDTIVRIQLVSFHVGTDENIDKDTKATLRLDFGKDSNSDSLYDTLFWSVAAGLNLYNEAKKKPSDAKDLKTDFNEAFSKRPIEIPGSLGRLSFEVVKHREPKWWQKIFPFFQSGAGKALISAIGFPAITNQAIGFLDELLNRLEKSNPEILFKSIPMTLALTQHARDSFTAGATIVNVGALNPGFCILVRGRDYGKLIENKPEYMGAFGLLKPKDMKYEEFLGLSSDNPFNKMTYVVIKIGTAETKLNPVLDYGT